MAASKTNKKNQTVAQRIRAEAKERLKAIEAQVKSVTSEATKALAPLETEREELAELLNISEPAPASKPSPASPSSRKQRSRKGGRREDQFVALVEAKPGINVSTAAKEMEIPPNYLYRVAKAAVEAKRVVKDGQAYQPAVKA